jgi:hypothetical protein
VIEDWLRYSIWIDMAVMSLLGVIMLGAAAMLVVSQRHKWFAKLRGANTAATPVGVIRDQMLEPRPLPMGREEFEQWSDRIIAGALVKASVTSQKWTLANMLLHVGPTDSHKPDAHFIHHLRVCAIKEAAHILANEYREKGKAELAAEEAQKAGA